MVAANLRHWGTVLVAVVVIPVSVLCTIAVMKITGMSFNLMTLGGIAAAIGLVIDDAIVVVESIYAQLSDANDAAVNTFRNPCITARGLSGA